MEINIDEIKVEERKRQLDTAKVAGLAHSLTELGLLNPITVARTNGNYRLVAGHHRLEAARLLRWTTIEASIFEGDDLAAELAEIDENLRRNDLTNLEQGEHLLRRNEILEERDLRTKQGDNRFTLKDRGDNLTPLQTTEQIAEEVGLKERTAQRRQQVAREICEEARDNIRSNEDVADNMTQLLALARMPEQEQVKITEAIKDGEAADVWGAQLKLREQEIKSEREIIAKAGKAVPIDDHWHVYHGNIETWQAPRKYDFIITDPPYPREFLNLYETLAIHAKEWLKPEGLLIAMCGQSYIDQIYSMMSKHLTYYWTASYWTPGQPTPLRTRQVNTTWKPLLIYSLDCKYKGKIFGDVFKSDGNDKDFHKWGQSISGMTSVISGICLPGQYILDPFCGAGTTGVAALAHGCLFDGLDIDIDNVNISRGRLHDAATAG